jgi:hypothetical protein
VVLPGPGGIKQNFSGETYIWASSRLLSLLGKMKLHSPTEMNIEGSQALTMGENQQKQTEELGLSEAILNNYAQCLSSLKNEGLVTTNFKCSHTK